jgi:hypothetical protein
MRDWIVQNRQWLFSGAGISIIGASLWLLKKLFRPEPKPPQPAPINNNSVVQAPVISVAPVFHLPHQASPPPEPTPTPPPTEEIDPRPRLYTLEPRIINVTIRDVGEDDGELDEVEAGIFEGGDGVLKAVVATFRMKQPSADRHTTYLTARLTYRVTEKFYDREIPQEIHRVNHGVWLGEEFNFVEMDLTDTKEVVLVLYTAGQFVAVQDNRHSISKYKEFTPHKLEPNADSFFVDVAVIDSIHGFVTSYTYKIDLDPLKVHEIIRVPTI